MNKLKYFLSNNIQMIWREILNTQKLEDTNLLITLGKDDVPIVMQINLNPHSDYRTQVLIKVHDFRYIDQFAGWVDSFRE